MSTKIEWCDMTWNVVTGCTKVSSGCKHCYAERMSKRLAGRFGYPVDNPFQVTLHPDKLLDPFKWKKSKRVFVCSMGDLFHEDVSFDFIDQVFAVMQKLIHHQFMVLTKRPERMKAYYDHLEGENRFIYLESAYRHLDMDPPGSTMFPFPNIWLGVSAENQETADQRIPILLSIPAAKRFVSCEPLLGPVDLWSARYINPNGSITGAVTHWTGGLDWVIVGGESGPGARPMNPEWVRSIRDDCLAANVPFFFKQWGEWITEYIQDQNLSNIKMGSQHGKTFYRVGKKKAGRLLDGREWNGEVE